MNQEQSGSKQPFGFRDFARDVLVYSSGNAFLIVSGTILVFIIPKYLSVQEYGYWQLFMLYSAYVGILHLGFINGIHVRWAGKELNEVGDEIRKAFAFLVLELVFVITPITLFLYFVLDSPLQWIGFMVVLFGFVVCLLSFFTFTGLATRRFWLLIMVNMGRGLIFLAVVVLLIGFDHLDYRILILAYLGSLSAILSAVVLWFGRYLRGGISSISSLCSYGRQNIKIGIFVLFGNFIIVFFLTIDRIMADSFFSLEEFAVYAFAIMVATLIYNFVRVVNEVFFPHLSALAIESQRRAFHLAKPALVLCWAAFLTLYFPATALVQFYLPQYVDSLEIMQVLFCTVGFGSIIQILHVSYYLAHRKQRSYFTWGLVALALAFGLNLLAILIWDTLHSLAIATLISFIAWYTINEVSLRSVVRQTNKQIMKGLAIIGAYLTAYVIAYSLVDWYVAQTLVYFGMFLLISWILLRSEARELASTLIRRW